MIMDVSRPPEYASTTFLMFSLFIIDLLPSRISSSDKQNSVKIKYAPIILAQLPFVKRFLKKYSKKTQKIQHIREYLYEYAEYLFIFNSCSKSL